LDVIVGTSKAGQTRKQFAKYIMRLAQPLAATGRVTDKARENLEEVANAAVADMFARYPVPSGAIPVP